MRATFLLLSVPGLLGAACLPPPLADCSDFGCTIISTGGSEEEETTPTTGGGAGVQTVTGDTTEGQHTSEVMSTSTDAGTTGEPAEPPVILGVEIDPNPITVNGVIDVAVSVENADGVMMALDDGTQIELDSRGGGDFSGGIPIYSGVLNGKHEAILTPFRDPQIDGRPVPAEYVVQLPAPGDELFWETGDLIGPGEVVAMATLPTGEVVEFGNHAPMGKQRCYLRRRDKGGAWGADDLVEVLPGIDCAAIDLQVDAFGSLYVLLNREGGDGLRWWFAKIASWGEGAKNIGTGTKGETATALAVGPEGISAVCGFAPISKTEDDGKAWVFKQGLPGETVSLDYVVDNFGMHYFSERVRDCQFSGNMLALVGEVNGRFELESPRDRLMLTQLDLTTKLATWTVAPQGARTQSGAQAMDIDEQGRFVLVGYVCDDVCKPEGELRIYGEDGVLVWVASLGAFPNKELTGRDIAWSPAGHAVVATGGTMGNEPAFVVRAFAPFNYDPVWTFSHQDDQVFQVVTALAIGRFGEVYAGGFGANGYPAVAYIAG